MEKKKKTDLGLTKERVGVTGWRERKRRGGLGFSKRRIRGERRSSERIGREEAVMDKRQKKKKKKRRRVRKEWRKRVRKMPKMSKKEMEHKDGERQRLMKEEGGVDGEGHREVEAQQVRVVDGQKKGASRR